MIGFLIVFGAHVLIAAFFICTMIGALFVTELLNDIPIIGVVQRPKKEMIWDIFLAISWWLGAFGCICLLMLLLG